VCRWFNSAPGHHQSFAVSNCPLLRRSAGRLRRGHILLSTSPRVALAALCSLDRVATPIIRLSTTSIRTTEGLLLDQREGNEQDTRGRIGKCRSDVDARLGHNSIAGTTKAYIAITPRSGLLRAGWYIDFKGRALFTDRDGEQASLSGRSRSAHNARDRNL
jgi:hypothetical protein